MRALRKIFLLAAATALMSVCLLAFQGQFLARWRSASFCADLDGDGCAEQVQLERGCLTVGGWQTPDSWRVEDALAADLDGDGRLELALLCWRRGSYGEYLPFWEEKNDFSWSQHIFLLHVCGGEATPVWFSSGLRPQIRSWQSAPGDDRDLLRILTREGEDTLWAWQGWGLVRLDGP